VSTIDDKISGALAVLETALGDRKSACLLFDGSPAGVVILHLLKRAGDGSIRIPVLFVRPSGYGPGILKFADKLRRIWRLDMFEAVPAGKDGGTGYTEEEMMSAALSAVRADGLIMPQTGGPEDESSGRTRVYRPLAGFTGGDVDEYVERFGLPRPYPVAEEHAPSAKEDLEEDEEAVAEKLRALGYM